MAFSTVPSVATTDAWTASQHNTYIKDNFAAVWVGTTAGDIDYYTSATAKSRVAIGGAGAVLYSTGTAPAWLAAGTSYQILRAAGAAVPVWANFATVAANAGIVASQAAGDIIIASSATALSRVALGTGNKILRAGGSAPEWITALYARQGGSATIWTTAGTNNYTPTAPIRQKGIVNVALTAGVGSTAVTYPTAFTNRPIIYGLAVNTSSDKVIATWSDDTTSGFTIRVRDLDGGAGTYAVAWAVEGD